MKNTYYKQCSIERREGKSTISQVAWIPKKFSTVGGVIKIKNDDDTWTDGWVVKSVGSSELEERDLPDSHQGIKGHRKRTGDALSK